MAEKEKAVVPEIIDNVEALEAKMKAMREAQKVFATYTQEQVDRIFYEAAMAANKQRIPLAKMAVEETKRGVMEDKVIKNHYAAEYIYNTYKDTKMFPLMLRPKKAIRAIYEQSYSLICLNDNVHIRHYEQVMEEIKNAFESILPEKSSFEL